MRKVVVSVQMTLDAVESDPQNWSFDYAGDEFFSYASEQLSATDTLIMGRETFEGFAEAWGSRAGSNPFADRMNSLPKYVASRTLKGPLTWNATLIEGDVAKAIADLKQQPGQDILQYGAGELTHTLLEHGLLDEIRLLVYPVLAGSGQRIFETIDQTALKLLSSKTFGNGVMAVHYQPVRS
jgi:dihydrofolate reductase